MAQDPPDASDDDQRLVTFIVGPDHKEFSIHKSVVCARSPVFDKALNSEFKEGKERTIVLEETEVGVFKVVMHWLYTSQLPRFRKTGFGAEKKEQVVKWGPSDLKTDEEGNTLELKWDYLMSNAYVFAHLYDICDLRKDINSAFEKRFEYDSEDIPQPSSYPYNTTIIRVFENVPYDQSSLCKTFALAFAKNWHPSAGTDTDTALFENLQMPPSFTHMALVQMARIRQEMEQARSGKSGARRVRW
ncbi:hypothetical protein HDK77DRAFT_495768 [Phyllosticta capitalensis]|uniref:BTB domain-containing protein n=1 Tax=Phyllosticta capitalensis TaxID=121624 RepID=A0ABR1YD13_9PEZI